MNLIALQQPIATDLRMIAACLKIITDIERVADQCADICDIITMRRSVPVDGGKPCCKCWRPPAPCTGGP